MILKSKKALVTGGSQGIGQAIAQRFMEEGAQVAIVGRSVEKLKAAQEKMGQNIFPFVADVTQIKDLDRLYVEYHQRLEKLDILVVNAGISQATPLVNATEEDFDRLIATNLKGVFFTVQRALPYLNEGASIILIASLAGKQGVKNFSIYAATKAAVISLACSFAAELLDQKIRVNSISPGVIHTSILDEIGLTDENLQSWSNSIPMHRLGKPHEIANAALFLASDQSRYVTATDIAVDGGVSGISPL